MNVLSHSRGLVVQVESTDVLGSAQYGTDRQKCKDNCAGVLFHQSRANRISKKSIDTK